MYEEQFSKRLTELRTQKGVSARDMSLSIGQNPGYIRAIESGTAFPTMANFFYICEYFNITPQEFFNFGEETSNGMNALVDQLKQFDAEQINALTAFIKNNRKKSKLSKNLILGKTYRKIGQQSQMSLKISYTRSWQLVAFLNGIIFIPLPC